MTEAIQRTIIIVAALISATVLALAGKADASLVELIVVGAGALAVPSPIDRLSRSVRRHPSTER